MKILLVEDEEELAKVIKINLEAECFAVDWANDGEKGSFMARTNDYDLILLDYILPKKRGDQVCKEIREDGNEIGIIMLTVKSEISSKVDLFNLGVDDYITKPFSYNELMARIRAVLRRPRKIKKKLIEVGNIIINPENQEVTTRRRQKQLYLTRTEFMILEYFAKNQGKIITRGELLEHVWDMDADPFSNAIEAHVLNLRRKFNTFTKKQVIKTIKGRGYRIN